MSLNSPPSGRRHQQLANDDTGVVDTRSPQPSFASTPTAIPTMFGATPGAGYPPERRSSRTYECGKDDSTAAYLALPTSPDVAVVVDEGGSDGDEGESPSMRRARVTTSSGGDTLVAAHLHNRLTSRQSTSLADAAVKEDVEWNAEETVKQVVSDARKVSIQRQVETLWHHLRQSPFVTRSLHFLDGPQPSRKPTLRPLFPTLERQVTSATSCVSYSRFPLLTLVFLAGWIVGFSFVIRQSYYLSRTSYGTPQPLSCTDTFWFRNAECGLNGTLCLPFDDNWFAFRCPSHCQAVQLLNTRSIGDLGVIYRPFVVGGSDDATNGTYRGDSFICQAALHHGLFKDSRGGCGVVTQTGSFKQFRSAKQNGIVSTRYNGAFPSSFKFWEGVESWNCKDLRNEMLAFNVVMMTICFFLLRPPPLFLYWILCCVGFWTAGLVTDPSALPPVTSTLFGSFIPYLFACYVFWRCAWRYVLPGFMNAAVLEGTVYYLGPWWVGVLTNLTIEKLPVQRLTAHDIRQQPGGLATVIVGATIVGVLVLMQLYFLRRAGILRQYLIWYAIGVGSVCIFFTIPGFEFRLHHYVISIILTPGTCIVGRPSALFQSFLLGIFQNGISRWGFESTFQTPNDLRGDGKLGTQLPNFATTSMTFNAERVGTVQFEPIPQNLTSKYNGFSLLIDDVLRYDGPNTAVSFEGLVEPNVPHYFRLAYSHSGVAGDFTKAAVMFWENSTWYDPEPGPS